MHDVLTLWAQWSRVQAGKAKGYPTCTPFRARLGGGVSTPVLSDTAGCAVDAAVSSLPAHERDVLCLAYLRGLPDHIIAERLRQPTRAVTATLSAARSRLADSLGVG